MEITESALKEYQAKINEVAGLYLEHNRLGIEEHKLILTRLTFLRLDWEIIVYMTKLREIRIEMERLRKKLEKETAPEKMDELRQELDSLDGMASELVEWLEKRYVDRLMGSLEKKIFDYEYRGKAPDR